METTRQLNDLYTAKLAHYNAWMKSKRDITSVYPGFPEQAVIEQMLRGDVKPAKVAKPAKEKETKKRQPRTGRTFRVPGTGTKLEQAKALYKANSNLPRAQIIELFMDKLSMSRAGATTYVYNCKKAAGY